MTVSHSEDARPLRRADLLTREMDGEFFLYDPVWDRIAVINHTAATIVDLCDGTRVRAEIVAEVGRRYSLDAGQLEQLEEQVQRTIDQLTASDLMTTIGGTTRAEWQSDE